MMRVRTLVGGLAAAGLLAAAAPSADAGMVAPITCGVDETLILDRSPLPNAARALQAETRLRVLAIGSMSTAGTGTSPATSWPARLEATLRARFPNATIAVVNRGKARQSAGDMRARMETDLKETSPDLVIWESGVVDALRSNDPEDYAEILLDGVDMVLEQKVDVVLMDAQFTKTSTAVINFDPYTAVVKRVADMRGLIRFPRFDLMYHWSNEGIFSFEGLPRPEQLAVVDRVYDCIARNLGQMIAHGVAAANEAAAFSPQSP